MIGINGREEVLEIDARAYDECRREYVLEIGALVIVRVRVVRWQKDTAIEIVALGERSTTDDDRSVRGVIEFRSNFGRIASTQTNVSQGGGRRSNVLGQQESSTTFEGILTASLFDDALGITELLTTCFGQVLDVVELDLVGGGVVSTTDKDRVVRDLDAVILHEALANLLIVGETREQSSVGTTFTTTAGTAIVRGSKGVVDTDGTVTEYENDGCEATLRSNVVKGSREHLRRLLGSEWQLLKVGMRLLQKETAHLFDDTLLARWCETHHEQARESERHRDERESQRADGRERHALPHVLEASQVATTTIVSNRVFVLLDALALDQDGARVLILGSEDHLTSTIHWLESNRDAKEAGDSKGLDGARVGLFDMATERALAIVDARVELQGRSRRRLGGQRRRLGTDRVDQGVFELDLERLASLRDLIDVRDGTRVMMGLVLLLAILWRRGEIRREWRDGPRGMTGGIVGLGLFNVPTRLTSDGLDGRASENRLHAAKVDEAHERLVGHLVRMRLHAMEHAGPTANLEHHGSNGKRPLGLGNAHPFEVLAQHHLGDGLRASFVLATRLEHRHQATRSLASMATPTRESERLERREPIQETSRSTLGAPLGGTTIEERRTQVR